MITGGSGPLGRAIATVLAQEGARVALASRTPETLEAAAKEAGKYRSEGKEYLVQDGDIMLFRFNV